MHILSSMDNLKATLVLIIMASSLLLPPQAESRSLSRSRSSLISETKKVTKFRFYLHDVIGGDKPTVWSVAECNLTDILPSAFGKFIVLDNLVTVGPTLESAEVGRLQGTVGMADLRERALVMVLNLVFTKGEYEGSTLSILGRNPLGAPTREVPIVGGTGAFRMASGFVITSTYYKDPTAVRNVYEYNLVVFHYDRASSFLA